MIARPLLRSARAVAAALLLAVPCALAAQQAPPPPAQGDAPVAPLYAPNAVQQRDVTTAAMNDSLVQSIEHGLRCTCGCNLDVYTCRTTDFTCATSPAMHRAVVARLDSALAAGFDRAQAARQVTSQFELQYGQTVLMSPPKRGFNWTAYIMPFVGLGVGIGIVVGLMRRWIRRPGGPDDAAAAPPGDADNLLADDDAALLKRELEHFEA